MKQIPRVMNIEIAVRVAALQHRRDGGLLLRASTVASGSIDASTCSVLLLGLTDDRKTSLPHVYFFLCQLALTFSHTTLPSKGHCKVMSEDCKRASTLCS